MKKILVLPVILLLLFSACGSGAGTSEQAATSNVPRTEQEMVVSGAPVTTADLSVEGMTCEMMCGGAIKKALAKVQGVSSTEIKFTEDETADHAIVTYDPAQVSDAEIVKAVEAIHDGQYKVSAVTVTKQVQGLVPTSAPEDEGGEKQEAEVSASLPELVMPNLFRILFRMLRM
jgi:copper chaperone CopZ